MPFEYSNLITSLQGDTPGGQKTTLQKGNANAFRNLDRTRRKTYRSRIDCRPESELKSLSTHGILFFKTKTLTLFTEKSLEGFVQTRTSATSTHAAFSTYSSPLTENKSFLEKRLVPGQEQEKRHLVRTRQQRCSRDS